MPQVPIIKRDNTLNALPSQGFSANLSQVSNPYVDDGFEGFTNQIHGEVEKQLEKAKKEADEVALINAQMDMDQWENDNLYGENGAYNQRGKNAFGIRETYVKKFDDDMRKREDALQNDEQKIAFRKTYVNRRGSLSQGLGTHAANEYNRFADETDVGGLAVTQDRAAKNFNNPGVVNESIAYGNEIIDSAARRKGTAPEMVRNQKTEWESKSRLGVLNAMIATDDPENILKADEMLKDMNRRGKMDRDEAMDFVIDELENSPEVIQDGKGKARFGINSVANPDVDLDTLDKDGAKKIYKERYWDKIDADSLPENIRLMAFDTAVNQGVGVAKELIEASGGDPLKFAQLRQEKYAALNDEENYEGWMNRLGKVYDYSTAQLTAQDALVAEKAISVAKPKAEAVLAYQNMGDKSPADVAKTLGAEAQEEFAKIVKRQNDMQEQEKLAIQNAASERAIEAIDAGGEPATADLVVLGEEQRKKLDYHYKIKNGMIPMTPADELRRDRNFETIAQEYNENPESVAVRDLAFLKADLNPDDYETVMTWRNKLGNDEESKLYQAGEGEINQAIKGYQDSLNDREKGPFQRAMRLKIDQFEKANKRKVTSDDIYQIGDKLIETIVFSGFDPNKKAFELTGEENFEKVKPSEEFKNEFLKAWRTRKGPDAQPPTDEQIKKAYLIDIGQ